MLAHVVSRCLSILAAGVCVVRFPLVPMLFLRFLACNLLLVVSCIEIAPGSYVHEAAGLPRAACSSCKLAKQFQFTGIAMDAKTEAAHLQARAKFGASRYVVVTGPAARGVMVQALASEVTKIRPSVQAA